MAGMIVLRQFCRNRNITRMTRPIASASVFSTSMIDSRTTATLSKASCHFEARREVLLAAAFISFITPSNTSSALADGSSWMPMPDAFRPPKRRLRRVVLGAELDAADVLHADERAVLAGLDDDVLELRRPR